MADRRERIVDGPHPFWFAACGIDTWARGSQYSRNDTPWTAFTADGKRLVCTVWTDLVADIFDPEIGRVRRFVVLGGMSTLWMTGAKKRGLEAQQNLERARAERLPIYGFEVAATGGEQFAISRSIKHVFLDRAHNLVPVFGRDVDALKKRLGIPEALAARWKSNDRDALESGMLFELKDATGDIPAADFEPNSAANAAPGTQDYWAWRALPALVAHVHQQADDQLHSLTYRELGERIGWMDKNGDPHARLGGALGRVTEIIEEATSDWPEADKPPYLTTIVVLKATGLPDVGIRHRWADFDLLSPTERRAQVDAE